MRLIPLEPRKAVFVDIGSGKGRLLMLARLMGYARVIGVEFSPILHAAALQNLAAFTGGQSATQIELFNMDATAYEIPEEDCVMFMFNPFHEPVLDDFLEHLRPQLQNRRTALYIVYVHPTARGIIESCGLFAKRAARGGGTDAVIYELIMPRHVV
jgi:tRNA1(Val) A37 N6-methylase TrmN6